MATMLPTKLAHSGFLGPAAIESRVEPDRDATLGQIDVADCGSEGPAGDRQDGPNRIRPAGSGRGYDGATDVMSCLPAAAWRPVQTTPTGLE